MTNYQIKHKSFKAEFKAGTYFIGDPCYALRDDLYSKWGEDHNYEDGDYGYFAVGSTAYGDGTYVDSYSQREFGVDAGILGVVNMQFAEDKYDIESLNRLGLVVEIKDKLIFEYNSQNHLFSYQADEKYIEIPTEYCEEDDDEEIDNEW